MRLSRETEAKLKEKSLKLMEKSRPGWNIPHVLASVHYMKELIKREGGDERILLPAIYLHDIGYAGIIESEYTFEAGEDAKPDHMVKGALMARAVLEKTGGFSEDETYEICRLISIHDNLDEIKGRNAQLVFEADCLAQVDRDMVKPNFDKENYMKFIVNFRKRRVPLFRTKTGIYLLGKVMPKAEKYFD